jgi:hypothetical protein
MQNGECLSQQSRHVHLRDPDLAGDLLLGPLSVEAQLDDPPLELRQRPEAVFEQLSALKALGRAVENGEGRDVVRCPVFGRERRDRERSHTAPRLQGLDDGLLGCSDVDGQLGDGRRSSERGRELGQAPLEGNRQLLQITGHMHGPAVVSPVARDLAAHQRSDVCAKAGTVREIEAIDSFQETDRGNLQNVV